MTRSAAVQRLWIIIIHGNKFGSAVCREGTHIQSIQSNPYLTRPRVGKRIYRLIACLTQLCLKHPLYFFAALPTLDIAEGALDKIFSMYKELLPDFGGYLTHAGQLHRGRLQVLLDRIGALELDTLEMRAKVRIAPHSHTPVVLKYI